MKLEVGRIVKPHGLDGDVLVSLITDRTERLDVGSVLDTDRGPVAVLASRRHQHRWIVSFDAISGRDAAEVWRGTLLRAEPIEDEGTLWIHELIGSAVLDAGVTRGTVVEVEANPASDLLVLDTGALVPLRFVVGTPSDGVILIDPPPGLFDL